LALMPDPAVVERILQHIDRGTTDLGAASWREPVVHYRSDERLALERERVLRRHPTPFCPSAALPGAGSYLARSAAGTPLLAVRGDDGRVRVFRNACRHRATQVAMGAGCTRAFVCPYHGWTYALDGGLRHVPHEHGFPGLEKGARGLVPVEARERHGIVFVTQDKPALPASRHDAILEQIPGTLLDPGYRLSAAASNEIEMPANWKIVVESLLEGYHIRETHRTSFYPLQYDNLNVVEAFGPNSRVAFPYQAVEKLRPDAPLQRSADGVLTYVYHLFPNAVLATFPGRRFLVVLEPLDTGRTLQVSFGLTTLPEDDAFLARGAELVARGAAEDQAMIASVQRGLASGANDFLEFGRFESAIGHFHASLQAALDAAT
jgi:phenylpropionate dioxygenase-like ring-hydroxylating dioxygenase large terminal subunit